jgi:hypothetical protein
MLKGKITLEAKAPHSPSLYHAKRIPLSKAQAKDFCKPHSCKSLASFFYKGCDKPLNNLLASLSPPRAETCAYHAASLQTGAAHSKAAVSS